MSGVENPWAFPRQLDGDEIGIMPTQYGMTLRDWFAGQLLCGAIKDVSTYRGAYFSPNVREIAAKAYTMADAMLAERAKASPALARQPSLLKGEE